MNEHDRRALLRNLYLYVTAMLALGMAASVFTYVLLPRTAIFVIAGVIFVGSLIYAVRIQRKIRVQRFNEDDTL